jgi:hypothetical protein
MPETMKAVGKHLTRADQIRSDRIACVNDLHLTCPCSMLTTHNL